jgi:hypothetical protein
LVNRFAGFSSKQYRARAEALKSGFFGKIVPFENAGVAAPFDAFPTPIRGYLLALRGWIFDVAASTDWVGIIR